MPSPRTSFAVVSHKGLLYVSGGNENEISTSLCSIRSVVVLNTSQEWSALPDLIHGRTGHSMAVTATNRLLVAGGSFWEHGYSSIFDPSAITSVEVLQLGVQGAAWELVAELPQGKVTPCLCSPQWCDKLLLFGGNNEPLTTFYAYDSTANTWNEGPTALPPSTASDSDDDDVSTELHDRIAFVVDVQTCT